jgi:hypothetical protein
MSIIRYLRHGFIQPLTSFVQSHSPLERGSFDGGVYDSSGQFCKESLQTKIRHDHIPDREPDRCISLHLPGSYIYGGLLQNTHFGHFTAESLTRLWAYRCLSESFSYFVFLKRIRAKPVPSYAEQLISLLCPDIKIIGIETPVYLENLAVPEAICGGTNGFLVGHQLVKDLVQHLRVPNDGSRVYVSRSRLGKNSGGFLCEDHLERYLQEEGYRIFHPQEYSLQEQLSVYSRATDLIFADGSTLHLYALVCQPEQRVFIVWRRCVISGFQWQISTFGGPRLLGQPAIHKQWVPQDDPRKTARGRAELDFESLHKQLLNAGMIQALSWSPPEEEVVVGAVSSLGSRFTCKSV